MNEAEKDEYVREYLGREWKAEERGGGVRIPVGVWIVILVALSKIAVVLMAGR